MQAYILRQVASCSKSATKAAHHSRGNNQGQNRSDAQKMISKYKKPGTKAGFSVYGLNKYESVLLASGS